MNGETDPERIRKVAEQLDDTLTEGDTEKVLPFFTDDCEIEMLGLKLEGKRGARKWLEWLYSTISEIRFEPVTIMIQGNTFFEEFIIEGKLNNGKIFRSRQAEVLIYEEYRVKSLRLYFDRMDFADIYSDNPLMKPLVKKIRNISIGGLK